MTNYTYIHTPDLDEWLSHRVLPVFPHNSDVGAICSAS